MFERVFVLEVSGPTLELLRERLEHLPNFRRLFEQGAWSRLRVPLQPVLPPSFATLLTGKNPGKTGLFDFFKFPAGGYDRIPYSTSLLMQEPFYRLLSRRGVRVGILNVPLTYPLAPVDGFVVSGDEGIDGDCAWPPEVARALDAAGYSVPFGASYAPGREAEFSRRTLEVMAMRRRALKQLFADGNWRFGMLTIHAFGEMLHAFWKFYDPRHPDYAPPLTSGAGDPFLPGFEALDQLLGDIIELTGKRGLVLVLGAWSHRLEHSRVHFNAVLEDAGYLQFKRTVPSQLKRLAFRLGVTKARVERLAHDLNLYRFFHYKLGRGKRSAVTSATFLSLSDVDWTRTRAVAMGYLGQIYLNVRGHRPAGVIPPADYVRERAALRDLLAGLRDPRSGQPVVDRVVTREEAYSGAELTNAPDLLVHLRDGYSGDSGFAGAGRLVTEAPANHSSDHWDQSFLLALGEGVRPGEVESRLEGVAPTVLHALGQPVPGDYDGRVLPIWVA